MNTGARRSIPRAGLVIALSLAACNADGGTESGPDAPIATDGSNDGALADGGSDGGLGAGWLYTSGNQILVSDGAGGGVRWIGRGVNIDDSNFCGGAYRVSNPNQALVDMTADLMATWKPSFVRLSLSMNSYTPTTDWAGAYRTSVIDAVHAAGSAGAYVLIVLRSHANMELHCGGTNDATCMPNAPTAMDAVYKALVNDFKNDKHVLFAITNEPGGADSTAMRGEIRTVMEHAAQVIRAEEDALGVPHHLIAIQGTQWSSILGWWNAAPLATDNVVYEYHAYPPQASGTYGYTQPNIPVIIGEYGPGGGGENWSAFYADVEAKLIPNLAWDYSPLSNCAPDLVVVGNSVTNTTATAWGAIVKQYLLDHAP